jgi:spoIIIJ-associated protein
MEGFKEFQGKDLDGAIEEACGYFNTAREKLEIEIVQDAKSGIFGIVGARKAKVRARRVQLREAVDSILGRKGGDNAATAQGAAQSSGQGSGQPANQAGGEEAPATAETRKNGGRPGPVAASAPAASGVEAPVASAQKPAEAPAAKGRDEGRDRTRQESRSPERGQDQRGQDQRSQESRPPRGQQDDRRNRGRDRNRPPMLDSYESEEALDAACNGNVLDKQADKPVDRRNDRNDRNDRNGKQDRNGSKPTNRNGRNDRRDRTGRNGEGDEAVAAGSATESAARESRGRRTDSRSESRGNGRGDTRPTPRDGARPERAPKTDAALDGLEDDFDAAGEGLPVTPLEQLDAAQLEVLVGDTVRKLIRPITGEEVAIAIKIGGGRVYVGIECDEDSGLLIGREGQTLAALQYMISRIVSRGMNAAVRVQLDAGEYRRRQDEKLREMALALADKVRQSGRSYSTRPLSSYHRRIVHVCLQEAADVQTRSTGDGPMKRVVIMRKKGERA